MSDKSQLHLVDSFFPERVNTRSAEFLRQIDRILDWDALAGVVAGLDRTGPQGGRPRHSPRLMVRALFLQHLYALSDPQLEEQVNDRLSFREFLGLGMSGKAPDFTSIWKFKDELAKAGLSGRLFEEVNRQLDAHGLIVRRGTIVDATMVASANRNVAPSGRERLLDNPQVDTDARKGAKGPGRYTFGYKAHVGVDAGSGLIRRRALTGANVHDSVMTESLCSGDEKALFGDKAYYDRRHKAMARQAGWFYGVLERAAVGYPLSAGQHRRNRRMSAIRAQVEHPFAWMKAQARRLHARCKSMAKNALVLDLCCMCWNLSRARVLMARGA